MAWTKHLGISIMSHQIQIRVFNKLTCYTSIVSQATVVKAVLRVTNAASKLYSICNLEQYTIHVVLQHGQYYLCRELERRLSSTVYNALNRWMSSQQ